MLRTLRIRDLAIVEDLTVEFGPGLNLLTGETGAGKSILVDALGLVCGGRTDRSLVRSGADRMVVEALFELRSGSTVAPWLEERGLGGLEEGQLVVRREVPREGAGRVFLDGSPVTLALLRELGEELLELHGQHEHRSLLIPERQLELLDRFGALERRLGRVGQAHARTREAAERLERLRALAGHRAERQDELTRQMREIDRLKPRSGELAELDRERRILRNAGSMAELLDEVVERLYEGERSAAALASASARRAEKLAEVDPSLAELAGRIRSASLELEDAGAALRDYRERADFDPARLETIESRHAALEALCRRTGVDEDGLLALAENAREELEGLEGLEKQLEAAASGLAEAEQEYARAACELGRARRAAASDLSLSLLAQLEPLALPDARFDIAFTPARSAGLPSGEGAIAFTSRGAERAQFLLAANPGEPLAPLDQVASGGELSRIMLALHVVAQGAGDRGLVFDEVDAGIGGAAADAVGARLAALAERQQVLCVTHLAQVAAYADRHYRVRKEVAGGRTRAAVAPVEGEARVAELARMMGGRRGTPTSRRHAAELLSAAGRQGARELGRRA